MRIYISLLALASLALISCSSAPPPVTTTTTVTREVTTTGPTADEVLVNEAPPAVRVETQTVSPGTGYVWTPGYWRWSGRDYVWISGSWVRPPRASVVWVAGHWAHRPRGWVWVPGHWR